jgi:formiminotetrahydrofolate cyclodeaminase
MEGGSFGEMSVNEFLVAVGSKTPTPGGGAVASAVGALGSSLAQMVLNYSIGKKNLAQHEGRLRGAMLQLTRASELFMALAAEDAEAYGAVNALSRLPEDDPRRKRELPEALAASVQVPMTTIAACVDILRLFEELASITNKHLRSDLAIAAVLADAAARSSRWNVLVNMAGITDPNQRMEKGRQMNELLAESKRLMDRVERACEAS